MFDSYGFITLPMRNEAEDIPNASSLLFLGSHNAGTDHIQENLEYTLKSIERKAPHQYCILIGKTDDTLNKDMFIPANVIRIYANNIDFEHQIIKFFPMGRDFRSIQDFNNGSSLERTKLCYCNYSMNTHPVRETIYQHIQDKSFIEFEHMGNFLDYQVSREHFFKCLFSSKFTICPRGNACDTFRFYDAIYCGCIPIVVKMPYHHHFDNLPVLFLSHEDDFKELTQEKLEEKYNELSLKHLSYYPELDLEYWLNSIKNDFIISQV